MISIYVIFSLRATHGARTVNFTPWDKGDSGNHINKTACNLIPMGDRLDSDPTVDFLDKDAVGLNGLCSLS